MELNSREIISRTSSIKLNNVERRTFVRPAHVVSKRGPGESEHETVQLRQMVLELEQSNAVSSKNLELPVGFVDRFSGWSGCGRH